MNPDYKEKAKVFLTRRLKEYEKKIIVMKCKRRAVKAIFVICITLSITSGTVCATLVGCLPPAAISILSTCGALATAISLKFNLKGKKEELTLAIRELETIKKKVDYVISCNGDFTENEFKQIIDNR